MDGGGTVHEFVEGKGVYGGNFRFGPIVTNRGCDAAHGTCILICVDGVAIVYVVGMTKDGG